MTQEETTTVVLSETKEKVIEYKKKNYPPGTKLSWVWGQLITKALVKKDK